MMGTKETQERRGTKKNRKSFKQEELVSDYFGNTACIRLFNARNAPISKFTTLLRPKRLVKVGMYGRKRAFKIKIVPIVFTSVIPSKSW